MKNVTEKDFIALMERYGFKVGFPKGVNSIKHGRIEAPTFSIKAKDIDRRWRTWFSVVPDVPQSAENLPLFIGNNTDAANIWLHETRPDLTAEKCLAFFADLNALFGFEGRERTSLRDWIDPEDWQEIAGVNDAYEDPRYSGMD